MVRPQAVRADVRRSDKHGFSGRRVVGVRRGVPIPDEMCGEVVVASPGTPMTHHVILAETLEKVRPGVHLANVVQGGPVDREALLDALDEGRVARATFDVSDAAHLPEGRWTCTRPRELLGLVDRAEGY